MKDSDNEKALKSFLKNLFNEDELDSLEELKIKSEYTQEEKEKNGNERTKKK